MFMHGPSIHCSRESVDIAFTYVSRISSPGLARITGGSSRPLYEKAAFPVWGSLTAVRTIGERASGGFETICDEATRLGDARCAADCVPPSIVQHIKQAIQFLPAFEVQFEITMRPLPPVRTSVILPAAELAESMAVHRHCGTMRRYWACLSHDSCPSASLLESPAIGHNLLLPSQLLSEFRQRVTNRQWSCQAGLKQATKLRWRTRHIYGVIAIRRWLDGSSTVPACDFTLAVRRGVLRRDAVAANRPPQLLPLRQLARRPRW